MGWNQKRRLRRIRMKGKKAKVCNRVFVLFCRSTRIYSARARCLESGLTYLRRLRFAPPFISESIEYLLTEGPPRVSHLTLKLFYVVYLIRKCYLWSAGNGKSLLCVFGESFPSLPDDLNKGSSCYLSDLLYAIKNTFILSDASIINNRITILSIF